jgi:2-iminoacetate synthase ThiH
MFPDAGLVLSTREPAKLRDGLIPLGITLISAGSHTEPGGYTGAGKEKIHHTERGRIVDLAANASAWARSEQSRRLTKFSASAQAGWPARQVPYNPPVVHSPWATAL